MKAAAFDNMTAQKQKEKKHSIFLSSFLPSFFTIVDELAFSYIEFCSDMRHHIVQLQICITCTI